MGDIALMQAQIGLESTRGTAVAATRKFYAGKIEADYDAGIQIKNLEGSGTYHKRRGTAKGPIVAGLKISDMPLDVRQILEFFQMLVKGGVTGSQQGSTSAYLWEFSPTLATDDLKAATIEWNDSNKEWQEPYSMIDRLKIAGNVGEGDIMVEMDIIGADHEEESLTGSLSDFDIMGLSGWEAKLFLDTFGGTAFSTNIASTLIDYEVEIKNNLKRKYFGDNTRALGKLARGSEGVEVDFSMTLETTTAANTEFANYVAATKRLIGLELGNNTVIEDTYKEYVKLYLPALFTAAKLDEDESTTVWKMDGSNHYDSTNGYPYKIDVMSDRAS